MYERLKFVIARGDETGAVRRERERKSLKNINLVKFPVLEVLVLWVFAFERRVHS